MNIEIKKANVDNAFAICEIEKECFSQPWSESIIQKSILNNTLHFFVAQNDEKIVGYGSFYSVMDEGYINNIAITKNFRKNQIGSKIVQKLIEEAEKLKLSFLSLEVRQSNLSAISLYEKNGFKNLGVRKNFYQNPTENAIIMTKYFNGEKI